MLISEDRISKIGCFTAEIVSDKACFDHGQFSRLSVMHEMRELGGRPPDSPRKSSFLYLLRIIELMHKSVGERGAEIIKGSLQDWVTHGERETPSVLNSRSLGDLIDFSRNTIAR